MSAPFTVFPMETANVSPFTAPPMPAAPVTNILSGVSTELTTQTTAINLSGPQFSCVEHLSETDRAVAQQRAEQLVAEILQDTQVGVVFGNAELEPVNRLVQQLLHQEKEGR